MNATCRECPHTWEMIQKVCKTAHCYTWLRHCWAISKCIKSHTKYDLRLHDLEPFSKISSVSIDERQWGLIRIEIWSSFCSDPFQPNDIWSKTSTFKLSFGEILASTLLVKVLSGKRMRLFVWKPRQGLDGMCGCVCTGTKICYAHKYIYIYTYLLTVTSL